VREPLCERRSRQGVTDVGAQLGAVEALPAEDMQGIGRVGYLLDPDGNVFGLISSTLGDGTQAMGM
jgi:hypothetical protein